VKLSAVHWVSVCSENVFCCLQLDLWSSSKYTVFQKVNSHHAATVEWSTIRGLLALCDQQLVGCLVTKRFVSLIPLIDIEMIVQSCVTGYTAHQMWNARRCSVTEHLVVSADKPDICWCNLIQVLLIRPPDIHVIRLRFYHEFFFLLLFVSYPLCLLEFRAFHGSMCKSILNMGSWLVTKLLRLL